MELFFTENEDIAARIAAMDRSHLIALLKDMHCSFPIDLTDEFLQSINLERLRHIVLATSLHQIKASA